MYDNEWNSDPYATFFSSITLKRSAPSPGIEGPANHYSLKTSLLAKQYTAPGKHYQP